MAYSTSIDSRVLCRLVSPSHTGVSHCGMACCGPAMLGQVIMVWHAGPSQSMLLIIVSSSSPGTIWSQGTSVKHPVSAVFRTENVALRLSGSQPVLCVLSLWCLILMVCRAVSERGKGMLPVLYTLAGFTPSGAFYSWKLGAGGNAWTELPSEVLGLS